MRAHERQQLVRGTPTAQRRGGSEGRAPARAPDPVVVRRSWGRASRGSKGRASFAADVRPVSGPNGPACRGGANTYLRICSRELWTCKYGACRQPRHGRLPPRGKPSARAARGAGPDPRASAPLSHGTPRSRTGSRRLRLQDEHCEHCTRSVRPARSQRREEGLAEPEEPPCAFCEELLSISCGVCVCERECSVCVVCVRERVLCVCERESVCVLCVCASCV